MKRVLTVVMAVAGYALLGGCGSDPASEAPVELRPGRYAISYEGAVAGFRVPGQKDGPGSEQRTACVTSAIAKKWPKALMSGSVGSNDYCSFKEVARNGNALTGALVCETDEERMPGGKIKLGYTGSMTETSTQLDAKMSFELPDPDDLDAKMAREVEQIRGVTPMLSAVSVVIKAERTGECNENG